MICQNCGANFSQKYNVCPYCKVDTNLSIRQKREIDKKIEKRLNYIDNIFEFKIEQDFYLKSVGELERYYNNILNLYINNKDKLDVEDLKEINSHLFEVFDKMQKNYPIRRGIESVLKSVEEEHEFDNNYDFISFLLNECNPSQVNAAAFKLRSSCERALQEVYKYQYKFNPEKRAYFFEKKYRDMFYAITGSVEMANKLCDYHTDLNLFVHENKNNDLILMKKYKTQENIVSFLNEVLETHKQYNLM